MTLLLGGLALVALLGFAAWTAKHSSSEPTALPCPPQPVAVVWSTRDAPQAAQEAVTEALREAGRKPAAGGWGALEGRDLVVVWTPGSETSISTTSAPVKLTLGAVPTAAQVREALDARLAPCEPPAKGQAAPAPAQPQQSAQESRGGFFWPWERGLGGTGALGLGIALWWLAGPNLVRGLARGLGIALWPLRLGWRKAQRSTYRRRLARGLLPAEWPMRPTPGQRWHQDDEAMHDRTTHRAQIAGREPERRTALRAAIRDERLTGIGLGPISFWRFIYRVPEGHQESTEV